MLFYGDVERRELPCLVRQSIARKLQQVTDAPPGLERHRLLVQALIETGELVQGLADQDFERLGVDDITDVQIAGSSLLLDLARAVQNSRDSGHCGDLDFPRHWPARLEILDNAHPVRLKRAEGYGLYCLYPENYLQAAIDSGLSSNTIVLGLRSIGTSLAALVAAAIGAERVVSLRPVGHPFDRHLAVGSALEQLILQDATSSFAIVDEGPGLSGSSFGCVIEWLLDRAVAPERIYAFPSHAGDLGRQASQSRRTRWKSVRRHSVSADETILQTGRPNMLHNWVVKLTGGTLSSWQEISSGGWRSLHYSRSDDWPPVHASMEKRKFLAQAGGRSWLIKFAGLDATASQRLNTGAILAEAGYVPSRKGVTYGFAVEEWVAAKPVDDIAFTNIDVVDAVALYLGFRANHLVPPHGGATLADLCAMAIVNTSEALGPQTGDQLRKRLCNIDRVASRSRLADTDNRMHQWEWLVVPGGRLLKTDAIDHNAAHDFVGCQDIAWDIAGATVEFALPDEERDRLAERVAAQVDVELDSDKLRLFEYCYLAFQIGLWSFARSAASPQEASRTADALCRYQDKLRMLLKT